MKAKRSTSRNRLEDMITTLKREIEVGNRPNGEFLPSELDLSKMYQLSKNTVRKGLDVLVSEGLLEKMPRIGARVTQSRFQPSSDVVTLRFGYYHSLVKETNILKLVEQFNTTHPHIQVQPIPVMFPRDRGLLERGLTDRTFDVMTFNLYNYEFLSGSETERRCLEPFPANEDVYSFLNAPFLQEGGVQYVRPFVFTPVVLFYNKAHFREFRLPEPDSSWSWEDLLEVGKKLSEGKDTLGFYYHLMSENRWPIFLLQNGVRFERETDGRISFRRDEVKTAIEVCTASARSQFFLSESDADAESLFLNEKASIIMATYSSLNSLKDAKFEYDLAPLPHLKEPRTLLVAIGIAVNRASAHREAAQLFADFLLSEETQMYIRQHTLSLPSMKRAAEWTGEEALKRPYRFHMYREIAHTFQLYSDLGLSCNELTRMRDELRYYWAKLDDLDTVLERMESSI